MIVSSIHFNIRGKIIRKSNLTFELFEKLFEIFNENNIKCEVIGKSTLSKRNAIKNNKIDEWFNKDKPKNLDK